ncbi:MAG: hypothetical protein M1819_003181 [Sarea resinae]|nr:MAG: hypothetical protein M1819_003181 [Sarea resinae]
MWLRRLSKAPKADAEEYDSPPPAHNNANSKMVNAHRIDNKKTTQFSPQSPHDVPAYSVQPPGRDSFSQRPTDSGYGAMEKPLPVGKGAVADFAPPEPLARAFSEAIRPYTEKIDQLESQLGDLHMWIEQLETQRAEVHQWIDKRGLRPDVPPSIAKLMDSQPDAAQSLNYQLDRKVSMVDLDLHRLQDDLNDSSGSSYIAAQAMTKFLPDIERLSLLQSGPRFAFDLLIKLAGNLNSHGGLEMSEGTQETRRSFYEKLDIAMVDVVRRRVQDPEDWPIMRDVKRIEKTAAYLRNYGIQPYFPRSMDAMRRELDGRNGGGSL